MKRIFCAGLAALLLFCAACGNVTTSVADAERAASPFSAQAAAQPEAEPDGAEQSAPVAEAPALPEVPEAAAQAAVTQSVSELFAAEAASAEPELPEIAAPEPEAVPEPVPEPVQTAEAIRYVLNSNTKKFHYPTCDSVGKMKEKNRVDFTGTRDEVLAAGYVPCKRCNP